MDNGSSTDTLEPSVRIRVVALGRKHPHNVTNLLVWSRGVSSKLDQGRLWVPRYGPVRLDPLPCAEGECQPVLLVRWLLQQVLNHYQYCISAHVLAWWRRECQLPCCNVKAVPRRTYTNTRNVPHGNACLLQTAFKGWHQCSQSSLPATYSSKMQQHS